jgi:uncharacterized MAPEG superfamily protein
VTGLTALLGFTAWTLLLVAFYASYRVLVVLGGRAKADAWTRGKPSMDPPLVQRAHHAHLNALENLPVFAAIVLAAVAMDRTAVVDELGRWVLYARIAQSLVHLVGVNHVLVLLRATLFVVQLLLFAYMLFQLLAGTSAG